MPDFFVNNSKTDFTVDPDKSKQINQSSKNYWNDINAKQEEKNTEYLEDLQKYSVNIPQEQYNIIKDVIADADNPEDEAYRWASALELNNQYGMPIQQAYENLEQINAALWGDKYTFTPKTNFKAIVDNGKLGVNTLKMGMLGTQIMIAEAALSPDVENLMAKYDEIEAENASLYDFQDRNFIIECLKFGAQSAPFTGYVAGASILGNLFAPGVGTAAGFAASMQNASGLEYMKLRKAGSDQTAAAGFALIAGSLEALVETSLGNVPALAGKKSLTDIIGKAGKQKIAGNLFKRLSYDGTFKSLALRMTKEYVKENMEEGLEEVWQDLIEKGTDALAAELGQYDLEGVDAKSIAKDAWDNFKGGVMGSLVLGLPGTYIKSKADIKEFVKVKNIAEVTPSQEVFNNVTDDSTVWEGLSDEEKKEAQKNTWEKAQARVEALAETEAKKIAEGLYAGEGAEERKTTTDENGNVIEEEAEPVARDEAGRLFTQNEVTTDDNGNVTGGTFRVGDRNKSDKNLYGFIKYETAENGDITITDFKMNKDRYGLRGEAFDEFAREHPDVKIDWNAIGSETQGFKNELIEANPSGSKNGLSYYSSDDLDNIAARKKVAEEVRKNIHNVKRNVDGSFTRTELSNKQVAAAVTLIESAARRMNMGLNDYVSKTFGNQIFGSREEFEQATLAQGENVNTKAGGMTQGVAQANWREVGQQVKAVIYAGENADFSTWAHEMAHVFQAQLDGDLKSEAETAFNVVGGDWNRSTYTFSDCRTMSSAEAFAYGFQDWLETGKAESEQMKNIFQKFAEFIADAYNKLRQHLNFTPEIESVFNKLLDGDDTIMSKALKAAQEQEGEYRAGLKRAEEEKQVQKKEAAQAEREEASEGTDFAENAPTAEDLLNGIEEAENETTEENNAIDDALEDLPLTDEEKTQIADVLKDESTTRVEKAKAVTEAASSVYDEDDEVIPDDMFFQEEYDAVRAQYENTDKWMKAPNGEDTNLTEKQWLQVRTPSFKKWFGDWENDKENASKVLDENGEPLVVYHGTDADFTIFDASKSRANMDIQGNFFSPWDIDAQGYGPNVRAFYLNIRKPANSSQGYSSLNTFKGQNEAGIKARELLKSKGFDGVNNDNEEYITFEPNQIKSATDNNGNFDENNPDILFQIAGAGEAINKDNYFKNTYAQWKSVSEKELPKKSPDYESASGSEYWYTDKGVYRRSNHWGKVASCYWYLNDEVKQTGSTKEIGYTDFSDIQKMEYADDREREIARIRRINFSKYIEDPEESTKTYLDMLKKDIAERIERAEKLNNTFGAEQARKEKDLYDSITPDDVKNFKVPEWDSEKERTRLLFQIAGEIGAENLDNSEVQEGVTRMQNLAIAKQMETDGKDAQAIRLATGWEKGSDGKWKYEIDDSKIKTDFEDKSYLFRIRNPRYGELEKKLKSLNYDWEKLSKEEQEEFDKLGDLYNENLERNEVVLMEILDAPELFRAYPQLREMPVTFKTRDYSQNYEAHLVNGYYVDDNSPYFAIEFNGTPNSYNSESFKSTLLHEIQHAIQRIEGFGRGGNLEEAAELIEKDNQKKAEIKNKAFAWEWKIELEKQEEKYPELKGNLALMNSLIDEYTENGKYPIKELEDEHWLPERDIRDKGFNLYVRGYDKEGFEEAYKEWQEKAGKKGVTVFNPTKDTERNRFNYYKRFTGEIESRNVQTRMNFTPEERRKALLAATEDVDRDDQIMLFQTVYHGTSANFDKFSTEHINEGEGSQTFGWGLYFSGSKDVATDYAERQFAQKFNPESKINLLNRRKESVEQFEKEIKNYETPEAYEALKQLDIEDYNDLKRSGKLTSFEEKYFEKQINSYSEEKRLEEYNARKSYIDEYKAEIETLQKEIDEMNANKENAKRNLYTVEIPDTKYLVWEKTVPKPLRIKIKEALYQQLINRDYKGAERELREELSPVFDSALTGQELYNDVWTYLGSDKNASKFLFSLGIVGMDYPAGTNFGGKDTENVRNYVIYDDTDAKIVEHLLFQTNAELMDEARGFDTWQEFMEHCELFHADDEVSPIPSDSDAQWYQSFWEQAMGVQTEQAKNEEAVDAKNKKEGMLPVAVDALFTTMIKGNQQMVDEFLQAVAEIDAIDLDSEEWAAAADAEDAAERERIDQLKDFINITLSDYNWQTALKRIQGGHEISEGLRKRLIGEMTDSFKSRDFRALYAEVMNDEQYAVAEEDSITATLNKKLKKYHDIVKPSDDISRWSPERRKQLAEQLQNREIAAKIKNGSLKLDDELDAYIKSLNAQIKEKQKQFDELEAETKADYQRIADKEKRDLLKLHEQLLLARGKLKTRNQEIERKIAKGLKITDKYSRITQNLNADYDEIFRKYSDLRNTITINAEVQAALDRQEQVAGLRDDLNAKQKEKNLTAEVKKMRIQLVKRAMRRVPCARIDYNNARTVIAIQRMLEPNLLGGVNRFIGIDSPYLRGVISQIVTDSDYKESIMAYLNKNAKASQAFADFKKKLEELKTIKDFDSWTAKDRKAAIRYLPKENWVRDLNLKELAKEREESIDLDIGMEEVKRIVYDEKTGEPKTYKDKEGNTYNVTETAFRLKPNAEIDKLVQDAVGADMFDKIVNLPFSEWTTEDLEGLAQRIDELYTEGRDLKAAKDEARKKEAAAIRKRIEDAIKETGITFNDDDTPEERERKQKEIDKILGMSSDLKGTEAAKNKGFIAKITRLLHSYSDMNVMRFARMLDGQSEGENYRMLYRKEDDCYNAKQRSMASRASTVNKVMADNKITEADLAKVVKVPQLGTEFTVDELLYFLAADKDYVEDEKKLQRGLMGLDANDDFAATSRNAVMFGNMMSDMMSQEEKEAWTQLDKDLEDALKNDTLTQEQKEQQAAGTLDKKPGTTRYIMACHAKWEVVLGVANNYLSTHPEYKALMEAIEADYASQYERMNEVSITEFNQPVHRVKAYVPLVRRESNGDTNEAQVKEDLLGANGVGKQWADRGMTQRRINISPLNQKPVQTGLFRTWGDSIERTEHFIAYAPYVRQLNAIYKSRDASYTRRFIESRYGKGAIEYLDSYINEVANPNAGRIRERGAEWLHILRGKTAPAYLGWKASGIIKQGLTSPWPYMQFVNPAEYLSAAMKFTFNPEMREAISEKSVYMKMRRMDPVNDLIDEMADNAKSKLDRGWSKFSQMGMQGLEFIDWACVAPGWLACYEKKYNQLQKASEARYNAKMEELKERNMYADVGTSEYLSPQQMEAEAKKEITEDIETEAVRYADDCTRACQPSNRVTDLAPLFKNSSEAMKAFLQFQTSLNVIWQNIRYDLPYAVKQKEFKRIAGTVIGYVMAGIFMNSVMDGIGGDDDDDDTQALRNLIYYSTTQFTDAIPIMGSEITNAMDKIITGKRAYSQSGTDMTPSATKLLNALQKATSGDFKKAAELTAEGIGLFMGAPVSGVKEINKLLGKPLDNGDVDLLRGLSDVYGIAGDILEE